MTPVEFVSLLAVRMGVTVREAEVAYREVCSQFCASLSTGDQPPIAGVGRLIPRIVLSASGRPQPTDKVKVVAIEVQLSQDPKSRRAILDSCPYLSEITRDPLKFHTKRDSESCVDRGPPLVGDAPH